MFTQIAVAVVICAAGWIYVSIKPPPPKICGSPDGPSVSSKRIRLRDGRNLAYKFVGVPMEKAKHKVVVCHGFHDSKEIVMPYSQEFMEEIGVCFVIYDRPGYGESDPSRKRPIDVARDVEELADYLQLGSRFYVLGFSMGGYVAWSCLLYIPHRLSGISLVAPMCNYYWAGIPREIANKCFKRLPLQDQWSLRIARYAPWLFYWFMTQKLFPSFDTGVNQDMFTQKDLEMFENLEKHPNHAAVQARSTQQGKFYSLYQDMLSAYGKWEHSPLLHLKNPFPNNEGTVHLWQGGDDRVIPLEIMRCIAERNSWMKYHELAGKGHMFIHYPEVSEGFLREILS